MIDEEVIDQVKKFKYHTYSNITNLQQYSSPVIKNIDTVYIHEYWYNGYKYNDSEKDTYVYKVGNLPYYYNNQKEVMFINSLYDLILSNKINPFILFVNGIAIKWNNVTIIQDYHYTYMKIKDSNITNPKDIKTMILNIPINSIRYGEDSNILENSNKYMYFSQGKLVNKENINSIDLRIEILNDDIYFDRISLVDNNGLLSFNNFPVGYTATIDNILLFDRYGILIPNNLEEINNSYNGLYGLFKIIKTNSKIKDAIFIFNMNPSLKQCSSINNRIVDLNSNSIYNLLKKNCNSSLEIWNKIIDPLLRNFDFKFDDKVSFEENINNAVKYITKYDFSLWDNVYTKNTNIKSLQFRGYDLKNEMDENNIIHLSRNHGNRIESVCMIFINHKLYKYMDKITYTINTINIPIIDIINNDDVIEIIIFSKCDNNIIDLNIKDDKTPVYINIENIDDYYIMASFCPNLVYNVKNTNNTWYTVDFTYTENQQKMYIIKFKEQEYYGKNVKLVSKYQFKYHRITDISNGNKFNLPSKFKYCHNKNQYFVFINGKKIDRSEFSITFMNKLRPFNDLLLYLSTVVDQGDYIDIFYVPEELIEKYKQPSMSKNGVLLLEDNDKNINYPTTYPMTKNSVMLFVNGLKVNPSDIKNVSLNSLIVNVDKYVRDENGNIIIDENSNEKLNVHQVNSIDNITIIGSVLENKEIAGYLNGLYEQIPEGEKYDISKINFNHSASDSWKILIKTLMDKNIDNIGIESIFGNIFDIQNQDINYKDNFAHLRSILYDIILEYYLSYNAATTGSTFIFDFEREYFDSENNTSIINLFPDKDKLYDYNTFDK